MYVLCFGIEGTLHQLFADPKRMAELCLCAGTLDEKQIENRKIDTFKQSHRQRDITGPYVVDFLWYNVLTASEILCFVANMSRYR